MATETLARRVELLTQRNPRPLDDYDAADVLADIEAQITQERRTGGGNSCSAEEEKAVRAIRQELYTKLKDSDWQRQDAAAATELQRDFANEPPDELKATTALLAKTQDIVANLITNVTDGLKQSVEVGESAAAAPTEQPGLAKRCLMKFGAAAKKTAVAAFSIVWFFLAKIYDFLRYIIGSSQFKLFLISAWRILRQHFCQFLAIKYGYDLKNYFARKMNPRTFYEGFLSKAIGQYFESSYFNNIFDTVATTIPELLQKIFGGIADSTVTALYGTLAFLRQLGSAFDIVAKVMTFLTNLFITALKTAMQLAFPAVIADWAESGYFDLIVQSVFFAGCYGDIFAGGGAALGAGMVAAATRTKTQKSSPKKSPSGGGKKPKDDDDSDDEDSDDGPGDLGIKIEEPQSREGKVAAPPGFPFLKTGAGFPGGEATETGAGTGFQFELPPPEMKSGVAPNPIRVSPGTTAPQPPPGTTPSETMLEKIGKNLNVNAWNVFTTVAAVLKYKMEQTTQKPKG